MGGTQKLKPMVRDSLTHETLILKGSLEYEPLPTVDGIRILELKGLRSIDVSSSTESTEPAPFKSWEIPMLSILTMAVDKAESARRPYDALSYCWSGRCVHPAAPYIDCDGSLVEVGPNLFAALLQLSRSNSPRALWADDLCISQKGIDERNQQVSLMGKIYASAGQVIVWLGDSDEVSELWRCLRWHDEYLTTNGESIAFNGRTDPYAAQRSKLFDGPKVEAGIRYMHLCGWSNRAWTFQEAVLARNLILRSGAQQVDWSLLYRNWSNVALSSLVKGKRKSTIKEFAFIEETRKGNSGRLLFLLLAIWTRSASEASDKVFAILGLCRGAPGIRADYRLTTREVMVAAAKACVIEDQNLDVLLYAGSSVLMYSPHWGPRSDSPSRRARATMNASSMDGNWHVPSWVPDWGSTPGRHLRSSAKEVDDRKLDLRSIFDDWQFNVRWNGENLMAKGVALGRIELPGRWDSTDSWWPQFPSCVGAPRLSDVASTGRYPFTKLDVPDLCMALRSHDQQACACEPASESEGEPPDWVCLLFGATAPFVLRPDCRFRDRSDEPSSPWNKEPHEPAWETPTPHMPSDRFVLIDHLDQRGRNDHPLQKLFRRSDLNDSESKRMARGLSCVLADFVIR